MDWPSKNYPGPDYLSSSRKRLAPQLIYKGGILHQWGKRMAVVVQKEFYEQLPALEEVDKAEAEIAWLVYSLQFDPISSRYLLERSAVKYTKFESAPLTITSPAVGNMTEFVQSLKKRLQNGKIMGEPLPALIAPDIEPLPNAFEEEAPDED
jgi:hypothetical protein